MLLVNPRRIGERLVAPERRGLELINLITTRSGSLVLPQTLVAEIFAYGGGGSGGSGNPQGSGGGGGAAGYSRLRLASGSTLAWSAGQPRIGGSPTNSGADGIDTTVTINGAVMTAGGGKQGNSNGTAAARSTATGFQINRYGGGSGEDGEFGSEGGGSTAGSGGRGGFRDVFPDEPRAGPGTVGALNISDFGQGGGGNDTSDYAGWGGGGQLFILLYRPL